MALAEAYDPGLPESRFRVAPASQPGAVRQPRSSRQAEVYPFGGFLRARRAEVYAGLGSGPDGSLRRVTSDLTRGQWGLWGIAAASGTLGDARPLDWRSVGEPMTHRFS